jgi:cytochrome c5
VNRIWGTHAALIAIPVAATALLIAVVATSATAQEPPRGEQVLNASCSGCHDLRPVQTSAKNHDEWNDTVQNMLQKGADVSDADIPVLVDYLTLTYGPLPPGVGQDIVLNVCTMCHDLRRVRSGRRSPEEWKETLQAMLNEGAPLSDQDFATVLVYLATNFNNQKPTIKKQQSKETPRHP